MIQEGVFQLTGELGKGYRADLAKETNIVGAKLLKARKNLGLTQLELSKRLEKYAVNVQAGAIAKWENGDTVPNAYLLFALCHALEIKNPIEDFVGTSVPSENEKLNAVGLSMLANYRTYLESVPQYRVHAAEEKVMMRVSTVSASAGLGIFLEEENFEMLEFPASFVPASANFGVRVNGDSMEPLFTNGQIVWVQETTEIRPGQVGLFMVDDEGFIKRFSLQDPPKDQEELFTDSEGNLHQQIVLLSENSKSYRPRFISPNSDFKVVGVIVG